MRNLTITRDTTFVGCAMKCKMYLKDNNGDYFINTDRCRLIAVLKNNSTCTCEIDEGENVVYAIYDDLSKDVCFGKKVIPAGTEDVQIHGKPKFSPFAGNPFRFAD